MAGKIMWYRKDILCCTELSSDEKLILSSLIAANYTAKKNGEKHCQMATDRLVKTYGMSYDSVEKTIVGLEKRGYFTRELVSRIAGEVWEYSLNEELNARFVNCLTVPEETNDGGEETEQRCERGTYKMIDRRTGKYVVKSENEQSN